MIDLKLAKADIAAYKQNIIDRNLDIDFDAFLKLESQRNELRAKMDELRAEKNAVSKEIPQLADSEKAAKIAEMKALGDTLDTLEADYKPLDEKYEYILHRLPNFLDPTAAIGKDDEENRAEEFFMEKTSFDFPAKNHWEIGEKNNWIDLEKGAEVSGI